MTPAPTRPSPIARALRRWGLLLALSALLVWLFELAGFPAALLMGPMLAGIFLAAHEKQVAMPPILLHSSHATIGCLMASNISAAIVEKFAQNWWLFSIMIIATIAACGLMGWFLCRRRIFSPASSAIWGLTPGAAPAMVAMADAYGADARLVAFMQYLRVIFVVVVLSLAARYWNTPAEINAGGVAWFPPLCWPGFAQTLLLALAGGLLGKLSRIPSGVLLAPMILGALLQGLALMRIELPEWFLALNFAFLGWHIGIRFTRQTLLHVWHALPSISLALLALIAFCGGLAFMLVQLLGIDPLTAYLATSPGGLDSIAIIAASCANVDIMFVMTMQTIRLLLVIILSPPLARAIARRSP